MNIDEAVSRACEEPTLAKALEWIAVWENDRAVRQALDFVRTGVSTASDGQKYDTAFRHCFETVFARWVAPEKRVDVRVREAIRVLRSAFPPKDQDEVGHAANLGKVTQIVCDEVERLAARAYAPSEHHCCECGRSLPTGSKAPRTVVSVQCGSFVSSLGIAWCDRCVTTLASHSRIEEV